MCFIQQIKPIGLFEGFARCGDVWAYPLCEARSDIFTRSYFFFFSTSRVNWRQQNEAVSPDFSNRTSFLKRDLLYSTSWLNSMWVVKLSKSQPLSYLSKNTSFLERGGMEGAAVLNQPWFKCWYISFFPSDCSLADGPVWSKDSQTWRLRVNKLYELILSGYKKVVAECDLRL